MSDDTLVRRLGCRLCVATVFPFVVLIGLSASADNRDDGSDERMLLLKSGRIVDGKINVTPSGYVIEKPHGRLVIPFEQVKLQAKSLPDAYRKLRATMPLESAGQHMSLARWCLSYELYAEARNELRAALLLEPNRESARRMLRNVQATMNPEIPEKPAPAPPRLTADGFQAPEAKSLSSLSRESAREFIRTVQPILINKCGNGSCHGTRAKNDFRLTRVRIGRGSHRVFVERNLAATLKFVDFDKPEASPLLSRSSGKHGHGGRAIFYGNYGADQFDALRDWVRLVAKEKSKDKADARRKTSLVERKTADTLTVKALARFEPSPRAKPVAPSTIGGGHSLQIQDVPLGRPAFVNPAVRGTQRLPKSSQVGRFTRRQTDSYIVDERNPFQRDKRISDDVKAGNEAFFKRLLRSKPKDAFDPDAFNRELSTTP